MVKHPDHAGTVRARLGGHSCPLKKLQSLLKPGAPEGLCGQAGDSSRAVCTESCPDPQGKWGLEAHREGWVLGLLLGRRAQAAAQLWA